MYAEINGMGLFGMNAFPVRAEISAGKGIPSFEIVGMADVSVQESKQRIRSAFENSAIPLIKQPVVVSLTPANIKKTGSVYDLAILAAVLAVNGAPLKDLSKSVFIGEVSLSGAVNPVQGALTMAIKAKEEGFSEIYLPKVNAREASIVEGIDVIGVENIKQLTADLTGGMPIAKEPIFIPERESAELLPDFADVRGQTGVKAAIEIAAAGFHNILMIGTPGTGKSMLAKRIPSILPEMTFDESIETTQIYSVAGMINPKNPLVVARPFRAVSHTASSVGLIGGGGTPRPGEISMAHNGVLFLDELPEFDRRTIETLRQPLENGDITISRASGSVTYPCNVMLVAAMNPCPCGNFGHPTKQCTCSQQKVTQYLARISQPVLDRIDIQVEVAPVNYSEISSARKEEPSSAIKERICRAREIQKKRYKGTGIKANSLITPAMLHEVCVLDEAADKLIKDAFSRLGLSARAYERVLKVARTAADLDGSEVIGRRHISRAIQYRSLDRKYWGRG